VRTFDLELSTGSFDSRGAAARWLRLALVVLLAWWTLRLSGSADPWCFLDYVNLAFHEAGHLLFAPFGSTMHVLGGTLGQLLVPLLLATWFLVREGRPFAAAACVWWMGESLLNVARYMADARTLELPLVGGGDHDWNELFYRFGLLSETSVSAVSTGTHHLGLLVMLAGLGACALFVIPGEIGDRLRDGIDRLAPRLALLKP